MAAPYSLHGNGVTTRLVLAVVVAAAAMQVAIMMQCFIYPALWQGSSALDLQISLITET